MIVEELIGVLGWDLKGEADLKKFKQGLADAERGMSQFVTRMATFAVAAGTAFAGGAALLGKSVISVSAQFEAYTHPHFLPVLRFFLFGADLPPASIEAFEAQVGNPKWFSGSDILGLTKKTRAIVRDFNLRHHDDEFFKLAIDNGLNHSNAESVRKAAVEASRR